MEPLISVLKFYMLTSFAAIHFNAISMPAQKRDGRDFSKKFILPDWVMTETVIKNISWQGLAMEIEFFTIPKLLDQFIAEIASLIPERSSMSTSENNIEITWVMNQISYVLLIETSARHDPHRAKGILSAVQLYSGEQSSSTAPSHCTLNWLPDDVKLIFTMGDQARGPHRARIDGYVSGRSFSDVRVMVLDQLKSHGWISLAEYPLRSETGTSTIVEAVCGNKHARIDLQKKSLQTRISVMSIEQ
jgi:hypothetical protein